MKIALTGGTGFLGRTLVQRLLGKGHSVVVLSRSPESVPVQASVSAARFDLSAPVDPRVLEGVDAVVHLAGASISSRWTAEHKVRIRDSRVRGTERIVSAVRDAPSVKALIAASAVGYYGNATPRDAVKTETSPPGTDFLAQVCVAWERALFQAPPNVRTAALRLGVVLHPEDGALKALLKQFRLGTGGPVGSGQQYVSWIHRDDAVRLFELALERDDVRGPLNATAPAPVTNRAFAHALGHALHRPSSLPIPGFLLKAALGEMASVLLEGQRVMPARALELGFRFDHPSLPETFASLLHPVASP